MKTGLTKKLVREDDLVAEVGVTLIEQEGSWTPVVSLEDACKLDEVRDALRARDVERASRLADHAYRLAPVHD